MAFFNFFNFYDIHLGRCVLDEDSFQHSPGEVHGRRPLSDGSTNVFEVSAKKPDV